MENVKIAHFFEFLFIQGKKQQQQQNTRLNGNWEIKYISFINRIHFKLIKFNVCKLTTCAKYFNTNNENDFFYSQLVFELSHFEKFLCQYKFQLRVPKHGFFEGLNWTYMWFLHT